MLINNYLLITYTWIFTQGKEAGQKCPIPFTSGEKCLDLVSEVQSHVSSRDSEDQPGRQLESKKLKTSSGNPLKLCLKQEENKNEDENQENDPIEAAKRVWTLTT